MLTIRDRKGPRAAARPPDACRHETSRNIALMRSYRLCVLRIVISVSQIEIEALDQRTIKNDPQ